MCGLWRYRDLVKKTNTYYKYGDEGVAWRLHELKKVIMQYNILGGKKYDKK